MATPVEGWDVQVLDRHNTDLLQGLGAGHALATVNVPVLYSSTNVHPSIPDDEVLRLRVGQTNPGAQAAVTLYFAPGV